MPETKSPGQQEFDELLAHVPVASRVKAKLLEAMTGEGRHYHNVDHLKQLWRRHRRYGAAEGMIVPGLERLIACAIAFHDSVYDTRRRDNEERSAELWMRLSVGSELEDRDREWVAATIRATHDHLAYHPGADIAAAPEAVSRERARVWVLDLDLTPLGNQAAEFDRNTASLRREAAHMTEAQWRAGQSHFIGRLLRAPQIFRAPSLARIFEQSARNNMTRLLQRIRE